MKTVFKKMDAYRTLNPEYQALTPKFIHLIENCLLPSWWVILFLLIAYAAYDHSLIKLNNDYAALYHQHDELLSEKNKAAALQQDLLLQINSQSDQDWVELTLMKVLGLVPEEQIKVLFTESN